MIAKSRTQQSLIVRVITILGSFAVFSVFAAVMAALAGLAARMIVCGWRFGFYLFH